MSQKQDLSFDTGLSSSPELEVNNPLDESRIIREITKLYNAIGILSDQIQDIKTFLGLP